MYLKKSHLAGIEYREIPINKILILLGLISKIYNNNNTNLHREMAFQDKDKEIEIKEIIIKDIIIKISIKILGNITIRTNLLNKIFSKIEINNKIIMIMIKKKRKKSLDLHKMHKEKDFLILIKVIQMHKMVKIIIKIKNKIKISLITNIRKHLINIDKIIM